MGVGDPRRPSDPSRERDDHQRVQPQRSGRGATGLLHTRPIGRVSHDAPFMCNRARAAHGAGRVVSARPVTQGPARDTAVVPRRQFVTGVAGVSAGDRRGAAARRVQPPRRESRSSTMHSPHAHPLALPARSAHARRRHDRRDRRDRRPAGVHRLGAERRGSPSPAHSCDRIAEPSMSSTVAAWPASGGTRGSNRVRQEVPRQDLLPSSARLRFRRRGVTTVGPDNDGTPG
jgi:hypothetical protein